MSTQTGPATIRTHELADDEGVMALFRASYPMFPHGSAGDYRLTRNSWEKHSRTYRQWVADSGGKIVGCALLIEITSTETGLFWADVVVQPERRHKGIGSRLLEAIELEATNLGCRRMLGQVLDTAEDGKAFCEKHGFTPNGGHGEQLSRLDVETVDLTGFMGVEEALTEHGLRIERLADLDLSDGSLTQALYRLDMDTHRDVPSPVEWVDIPFDEWLDTIALGPGRSPEWTWAALDGPTPVGLARLRLYEGNAAGNAYTGVRADYRGRGIARALKYRTVTWCRDRAVRYIYTGNSVENRRMLAINRSLGYEPLPRTVEVVRDLA